MCSYPAFLNLIMEFIYVPCHGQDVYKRQGYEWLDTMNLGVNKGAALKKLQNIMNISKEETMVFGDNYNDIEMLEQAAYSYAVGNARDRVKEKAKYITDTNRNDGVLKVIKMLL